MTISPVNLNGLTGALAASTGSLVNLKTVAANATNGPITAIQNRAAMTDLTQDLLPRMGVTRIMFSTIQEAQGEYGGAGEQVLKPLNDFFNQVRFVGSWTQTVGTGGQYVNGPITGLGYMEVTFLGTGLNILTRNNGSASYSVDGGSTQSVTIPSFNSILDGHNYNENIIISVVQGLTYGVHTVKFIDTAGSARLSGVEVIAATTSLQYPLGSSFYNGVKQSSIAAVTDTYNSNFQSGTLSSTYGGNVLMYQASSGLVQKAIQSNTSGPLYLTSANHSNESVIRVYRAREFGSGVGAASTPTDYSLDGNTARSRFFVLDDGTTNLNGSNQRFIFNDALGMTTTGDLTQIGFVGTGLDVYCQLDATSGGAYTVLVDGISAGTITATSTGQGNLQYFKIASGLAYGYHTVRLTESSGSSNFPIDRFIVYGPSLPSLPSGAVALANYYIPGTYVAASGGGGVSGTPSIGTIFKAPSRELMYVGTWGTYGAPSPGYIGGNIIGSTTVNDYVQYTFFGTGIEFHATYGSAAGTWTIQIDGSNYTGSATVNTSSTGSWTPGTSAFVPTGGNGASLQITGLALGVHTIKATLTSAGSGIQYVGGMSVITPLHSPKSNVPGDLQAALSVGNNAIGDLRVIGGATQNTLKNWSQAFGVTSNPTTTSSNSVPMPDMTCIIRTSGNPIEIYYMAVLNESVAGDTALAQAYVDGVAVGVSSTYTGGGSLYQGVVTESFVVPVSAGVHVVQLFWAANSSSTLTAITTRRELTVREIS